MLYNDLCLNQEKTAWVIDSYLRSRLWLANRCICVVRTEYKKKKWRKSLNPFS